jgi:hypothetical protein
LFILLLVFCYFRSSYFFGVCSSFYQQQSYSYNGTYRLQPQPQPSSLSIFWIDLTKRSTFSVVETRTLLHGSKHSVS